MIFESWCRRKNTSSDYLKGIEEVKEIVKEYSPQKTAPIIGIDSLEIEKNCKRFCEF